MIEKQPDYILNQHRAIAIRQIRRAFGLSMREFAKLMSISVPTLSRVERGELPVTPNDVIEAARVAIGSEK